MSTRKRSQRVAASSAKKTVEPPSSPTPAPTKKTSTRKAATASAAAAAAPAASTASTTTKSAKASTKATTKASAKDTAPKSAAKATTKAKAAVAKEAPKKVESEPATKSRSSTRAKSSTATKAAAANDEKPAPKPSARKRKVEEHDDDHSAEERPVKRAANKAKAEKKAEPKDEAPDVAPAPKPKAPARKPKEAPAPKAPKPLPVINQRPTERFQVLANGEGSSGELGLGPGSSAIDIPRAKLNPKLDGEKVGVVQVACGGMHTIALTHDGQVLTWGVNDDGALGRDTTWDGGLRDMDDENTSNDGDLNPLESKPGVVPADSFPPGTNIVQVAACDSASFVLTDTGLVYGWGIFRDSGGNWGFTLDKDGNVVGHQRVPMLIPNLQNIVRLVGSQNFVLALDKKGNVFGWGNGQQNELGHRVVERRRNQTLLPAPIGLPRNKIVDIAAGAFHAFAIDKAGDIYAWGANNFGQTGIPDEAGKANASIVPPRKVAALADRKGHDITLSGGNHHSIMLDKTTGEVLTWGRVDGCQVGFSAEQLEQIASEDEANVLRADSEPGLDGEVGPQSVTLPRIRILLKPSVLPLQQKPVFAAAAQEHNYVVCDDGKLYTWGFNANYQCGVGHTDDVETPKWAGSKDLKGQTVVSATGGGQFSIVLAKWPRVEPEAAPGAGVGAPAAGTPKTNGKA